MFWYVAGLFYLQRGNISTMIRNNLTWRHTVGNIIIRMSNFVVQSIPIPMSEEGHMLFQTEIVQMFMKLCRFIVAAIHPVNVKISKDK